MSNNKKRKSGAGTPLPGVDALTTTVPAPVPSLPTVPVKQDSQSVTDRKVEKFLKAAFRMCIEQCRNHFIINKNTNVKISTAGPFMKAVNPFHFPDYATVVTNPMDLLRMEKKLDKYVSANVGNPGAGVVSILADMILIRDNAHLYNTGPENLEVRIMSDCLLNYFRYLMRISLKLLIRPDCPEVGMRQSIIGLDAEEVMREKDPQDVQTYLKDSKLTEEFLLEKYSLYKLCSLPSAVVKVQPSASAPSPVNVPATTPRASAAVPKASAAAAAASSSSAAPASKKKKTTHSAAAASAGPIPVLPPAAPSYDPQEEENDLIENSYYNDNPSLDPYAAPASATAAATVGIAAASPPPKKSGGSSKKASLKRSHEAIASPPPPPAAAPVYEEDPYGGAAGAYDDGAGAALPLADATFPWEEPAQRVLSHLFKHPYIDNTKPTVIADFLTPIAMPENHPANVSPDDPLDLTTLKYMLDIHHITAVEVFYRYVVNIFQYAYEYNAAIQETEYAVMLVKRLAHLVQYTRWLCLELLLPFAAPVTHSSSSSSGGATSAEARKKEQMYELSKEMLDEERKTRMTILASYPIAYVQIYTECKKLFKDLERCRNNAERIQLSYFLIPVNEQILSDYSVYVRNPIDLSTIKFKLDGTLPTDTRTSAAINKVTNHRYQYYSEVIDDLRRVFTNALKYNKVHLTSDTTGLSKAIYHAAEQLQAKLETLIPMTTVSLADRVERARIFSNEAAKEAAEKKLKQEREEREAREFEQRRLAELKARDSVFAADYDIEKKRQETERAIKQQYAEQQRLATLQLLQSTTSLLPSNDTALAAADDQGATSPSADPFSTLGDLNVAASGASLINMPLIYGFGVAGKVPLKYAHLIAAKIKTRTAVWKVCPAAPRKKTTSLHTIKRNRASIVASAVEDVLHAGGVGGTAAGGAAATAGTASAVAPTSAASGGAGGSDVSQVEVKLESESAAAAAAAAAVTEQEKECEWVEVSVMNVVEDSNSTERGADQGPLVVMKLKSVSKIRPSAKRVTGFVTSLDEE